MCCCVQALSDLCLLLDSISCLRQHASSLAEDGELTPSVSSGADIHALLKAVPAYCCTADLLFKATPELVEVALSISTADISRLLTHTWLQVLGPDRADQQHSTGGRRRGAAAAAV